MSGLHKTVALLVLLVVFAAAQNPLNAGGSGTGMGWPNYSPQDFMNWMRNPMMAAGLPYGNSGASQQTGSNTWFNWNSLPWIYAWNNFDMPDQS